MMLKMQPKRQRENKKYFTEFSPGLEDLERKTNHRNILAIFMRQNNQNLFATVKTFCRDTDQ